MNYGRNAVVKYRDFSCSATPIINDHCSSSNFKEVLEHRFIEELFDSPVADANRQYPVLSGSEASKQLLQLERERLLEQIRERRMKNNA